MSSLITADAVRRVDYGIFHVSSLAVYFSSDASQSTNKSSLVISVRGTINVFFCWCCIRKCIFHRYHDASKARTERVKDCQHCNKSLLGDPVLQDSASAPPGNDTFTTKPKACCFVLYCLVCFQMIKTHWTLLLLLYNKIKAVEVDILCRNWSVYINVRQFFLWPLTSAD